MATTRLMPLHAGKGRTVAEALGRTTDYVKNPEKTDGGELVTAYECNPAIVDQEFLFLSGSTLPSQAATRRSMM